MHVIVNVAHDWGIGKDGDLLAHIKADMQFFRKKTMGNVVVMGRKTLESFPGQNPLPDRVNVVITKNKEYQKEGVIVVHSIAEAVEKCKEFTEKEIFVIGGETIYQQMLPYCETAFITKMDVTFAADTYFPNLDESEMWEMVEEGEKQEFSKGTFRFTTYQKVNSERE